MPTTQTEPQTQPQTQPQTGPQTAAEADRALKAKHRTMWALGDYPAVADEVIPALGPVLVEAAGVHAGDRVLDVAAGDGNATLPAARIGAHVVASDLTPELINRGRATTDALGLEVEWQEADAEALPFADHTFDRVLSCVGVMFAPHHQPAADELVRVCRPGGTIGLLSWTPEGFIGQMFATLKPYVAAPPPGVQPAPLWGDEDHVRALLGDRAEIVTAVRAPLAVDRFTTGAEFRDFFKSCYGPMVAAYAQVTDSASVAVLDGELADLADRYLVDGTMPWEYLLLTARKH